MGVSSVYIVTLYMWILWGCHGQLNHPYGGKTLQILCDVCSPCQEVCLLQGFTPEEKNVSACVCFVFLSKKLLNTWSDSSFTLLLFFYPLRDTKYLFSHYLITNDSANKTLIKMYVLINPGCQMN